MSAPESRWRKWRPRLMRWVIRVALALAVLLIAREIIVGVLWRRYGAAQDRTRERLAQRDGRRAPLAGPVQSGNAWDDYDKAIVCVGSAGNYDSVALSRAFSPLRRKGDDAKATEILQKREYSLHLLDEGARRESCRHPVNHPLDTPTHTRCFGLQRLGDLAEARTRQRLALNDLEGAFGSAITTLQFALDIVNGPDVSHLYYGAALLDDATEAVRSLLLAPEFGREPALLLEAILLAAEAQMQSPGARLDSYASDLWHQYKTRTEELEFPRGTIRGEAWSTERYNWPPPWWTLWRTGFSYRLLVLDALRIHAEVEAQAATTEGLAWSEAGQNPANAARIYRGGGLNLRWDETYRLRRAKLRLLRAALQIRRGDGPGSVDWPQDPFSLKPMRLREAEGWRVLWSEGPDGDQGGVGEWNRWDQPADIVLLIEEAL